MPITLDGTLGITTPSYGGADAAEYLVPVTAFKNRVINGAMDIWQRGTSGSSGFVADRWLINSSNTTSAQSSDVPTGFRFSNLMTGTNATNAQLTTRIESLNCTDLVGQAITVSFWAKSTSGSTQLGTYITHANTQDNFGATTQVGSTTNFTLTSSWAQYSVTFTTNAPAGVANGIQFGLFRSGTESSTTFITGVQLEKGSTATSFDTRSIGQELLLCQRYFEILQANYSFDLQVPNGSYLTHLAGTWRFIVPKRASPSCAMWPGLAFTNLVDRFGIGTITPNTIAFDGPRTQIVKLALTFSTGYGQGEQMNFAAAPNDNFAFASAEL